MDRLKKFIKQNSLTITAQIATIIYFSYCDYHSKNKLGVCLTILYIIVVIWYNIREYHKVT